MKVGRAGEEIDLIETPEGLTLTDGTLSLCPDYKHLLPRMRSHNLQQEILVKAAHLKSRENRTVTILDATAGFGEDSVLLAAAGYQVTLCERDSVIAAMLRDALRRAGADERLQPVVERMQLVEMDSICYMDQLNKSFDKSLNKNSCESPEKKPNVIFLDPMFPERQKSALVKKKFQLLHHLESPCPDEKQLLDAAMALHPQKIVIKRPLKGPYLAGQKPSYSLEGKAIRVDVLAMG